jgi:uncharacterized protein YgiM (DUF1202 family)
MKKLSIFFCLVLFVAGFAAAQVSRGGTLFVAIRTVDLKSGTGWFASNRGRLNYGDQVTVLQVSGKFVEVRSTANPSLTGWTASANMSTRPVVAGATGTATAREVALAGKGFNQEVEDSFRAQNDLNFDDVDRVEAITVDMGVLRRFLEEGRLSLGDN